MSAKTGALWERKDDNEEEEDVPVGRSKLFLNRRIHRDYRVNEIFRKKATKLDGVADAEDDDNLDEFGNIKTEKVEKTPEQPIKQEEKEAEEAKTAEEEVEKKKVDSYC